MSLSLLLSACAFDSPLPFTPIQLMNGSWPPPAPVSVVMTRNYVAKGDTLTFTQSGLSVTRPSQKDWAFEPGNDSVMVRFRHPEENPAPVLMVQVIPIPADTDFYESKKGDRDALEKAGATVSMASRTVDGVQGEEWTIEQPAPEGGMSIKTLRVYVLQGSVLTLIQAQAEQAAFEKHLADFEKMIDSVRLPKVGK